MKKNTEQKHERNYYILPFSAQTEPSLKNVNDTIIHYVKSGVSRIEDVSYSLCRTPQHFDCRNFIVAGNLDEIDLDLAPALDSTNGSAKARDGKSVVFMFSGQGSQYLNMGFDLYSAYAGFRKYIDECATIVAELLHEDIREILFNDDIGNPEHVDKLSTTKYAQPCIFSLEYSLAKFWMDLGVVPCAMIGHSIGEFVAATVAGTFSLKDALTLIVKRNDLWSRVEGGGMLSIPRGQAAVQSLLTGRLSIASVNSPFLTIVSGPNDELEKLKENVESGGKICSYLPATHAFHSRMMDPIIPEFKAMFAEVSLRKSDIPIMSTVTGTWLRDSEAVDPLHWADNVTKPVLFSQGISKILSESNHILLEVGPGSTLATLTKCHRDRTSNRLLLTSLRHSTEDLPDSKVLLTSVGKLWAAGIEINFEGLFLGGKYETIKLPEIEKPPTENKDPISSPSDGQRIPHNIEHIREALVSLWKETLMLDEIDTTLGFYQLGGDSLSATAMVNRLKRRYGLSTISIGDILENSTLEKQVALIGRLQAKLNAADTIDTTHEIGEFEKREIISSRKKTVSWAIREFVDNNYINENAHDVEVAPASAQQAMMWYLKNSSEQGKGYNLFRIYRLQGPLAYDLLEQSINILFRNQKSFYTYFREKDNQLYQIVLPPLDIKLPVVDMKHISIDEVLDKSGSVIREFLDIDFDMTQWPLFKICLMEFSNQEYLFCLVKDHIIGDWYSMGILYTQLSEIYNSLANQKPYEFKDLRLQYFEHSMIQEHCLRNGIWQSQIDYWKNTIKSASDIRIPVDYVRDVAANRSGNFVTAEVSEQLNDVIKKICKTNEVSLYVFLLTAFGILLQRLSGKYDFNLGLVIAGRNNPDTENLIGMFANCILAQFENYDELTFEECLRSKRSEMYRGYDNQDVPFGMVAQALSSTTAPEAPVLSPFFFDMLIFNDHSFQLTNISVDAVQFDETESRAYSDLSTFVIDKNSSFEIRFSYDVNVLKRKSVEKMLQQYCHLLSLISNDPKKRISEYPLRMPEEDKYLPDPTHSLASSNLNSSLFARSTRHNPNQTAITDGTTGLSYKETEVLSDKLASYFAEEGIEPGQSVLVFADGGLVSVLTVLAMMKMDCLFSIVEIEKCIEEEIYDRFQTIQPQACIFIENAETSSIDKCKRFGNKTDIEIRLPRNTTVLFDVVGRFDLFSSEGMEKADCADSPVSVSRAMEASGSYLALYDDIARQIEAYGIKENYRFAMLSALSSRRALYEICVPMYLGAPLFIPDEEHREMPEPSIWLKNSEIDVISISPSMGRRLTENTAETVASVKLIFCGGGRLEGALAIDLKKKFPNARIVNCYGTSATRRHISYYEIPEHYFGEYAEGKRGLVYIGQGTETGQLLVVQDNRLAAVGEPGEIWVRSHYLPAGFSQNDRSIEQMIITNPFTGDEDDKILKTGDLGRYTTEGYIEFLGRL